MHCLTVNFHRHFNKRTSLKHAANELGVGEEFACRHNPRVSWEIGFLI